MSYSREDRKGAHRANYERNRKRILATQNTCGICGHHVDLSLKTPHPMSATVDHIIPVAKNGHPSDINNLQLAHWTCNRQKSDKIFKQNHETKLVVSNRNLPQSLSWINYNKEMNKESNSTKEQSKKKTYNKNKIIIKRKADRKQEDKDRGSIIKIRRNKAGN